MDAALAEANDPSTPPGQLLALVEASRAELRRAVAGNPNAPAEALTRLIVEFTAEVATNPAWSLYLISEPQLWTWVRQVEELAMSPACPVEFLRFCMDHLADDECELFPNLLSNLHLPVAARLEALRRWHPGSARNWEPCLASVLPPDELAWAWAALPRAHQSGQHLALSHIAMVPTPDPVPEVPLPPPLSLEAMERLFDRAPVLARVVLALPECPVSLVERAAESGLALLEDAAALCPKLPEAYMVRWLAQDASPLLLNLAQNPSLPEPLQLELARRSRQPFALVYLAQRQPLPAPVARLLLAHPRAQVVAEDLARNPSTPSDVLQRLAEAFPQHRTLAKAHPAWVQIKQG